MSIFLDQSIVCQNLVMGVYPRFVVIVVSFLVFWFHVYYTVTYIIIYIDKVPAMQMFYHWKGRMCSGLLSVGYYVIQTFLGILLSARQTILGMWQVVGRS